MLSACLRIRQFDCTRKLNLVPMHMICKDRRWSASRGRRLSPIVTDHMATLDTAFATVGDQRSG